MNSTPAKKTGRNDLCPCGSGKKYKQCCLLQDSQPEATSEPRKLHIGGQVKSEGWEVLNANPAPYVDHVCNANNLSRFADNTFAEIYASHVAEHFDYNGELGQALKEWNRVLKPGGHVAFEVGEVHAGKTRLEEAILPCGLAAGLTPRLIVINDQNFHHNRSNSPFCSDCRYSIP